MTSPQDVVEKALAASSSRGCVVLVSCQSVANLRWARNTLTTNGETVTTSVTVVALVDVPATATSPAGVAAGSVSVSAPTLGDVPDVVRRAEAMAVQAGPAEDATALVAGGAASADWSDTPVVVTSADLATLASRLGQVLASARGDGIELFGYAEQAVTTLYLGTSEGVRRRFAQPEARLEITAKSHGRTRSSWAGRAARELDSIDVEGVDRELRQGLAWQARSMDVPAGRHTAVLSPASVADLMIELYWSSIGRDAADGQSVWSRAGGGTRLGEVVADPRVSLWSDPAMDGYESMPFVAAGGSSAAVSVFDNGLDIGPVRWIADGSLANLITSRHTSATTSLPLAPGASNLRLDVAGGHGDLADVVGRVDDGLLVTCLWYNRILDAQTLLLTGLTRDGVYQVKGGEVVGAVTNFRFNDSPVGVLGRIADSGSSGAGLGREMADYFTRSSMPTLVVDGFNFSTVSPAS